MKIGTSDDIDFVVKSGSGYDYGLQFVSDQIYKLKDDGAVFTKIKEKNCEKINTSNCNNMINEFPYVHTNDFGFSLEVNTNLFCNFFAEYNYNSSQYFNIESAGKFKFIQTTKSKLVHNWQGLDEDKRFGDPEIVWNIINIETRESVKRGLPTKTSNGGIEIEEYLICLKKGIYQLMCTYEDAFDNPSNCISWRNDIADDEFSVSLEPIPNLPPILKSYKSLETANCPYTKPIPGSTDMFNPSFSLPKGKKMLFSAWVRESVVSTSDETKPVVKLDFGQGREFNLKPTGPIIEGWRRCEGELEVPASATNMKLHFINNNSNPASNPIYFDDIRIHPYNANMKSYVYDPVSLRLTAELDANNYASFYEYDEEGVLVRTKAETKEGIKTITESRSAKQRLINSPMSNTSSIPPSINGNSVLPNAVVNSPYNFSFDVIGTPQLNLVNLVKPNWMTVTINNSGNKILFSGTPTATANNQQVSFTIDNGNSITESFSTSGFDVYSNGVTITLKNETGSTSPISLVIDGVSYTFPAAGGTAALPNLLNTGSHLVKFNCSTGADFKIQSGNALSCGSDFNWTFNNNSTITVY